VKGAPVKRFYPVPSQCNNARSGREQEITPLEWAIEKGETEEAESLLLESYEAKEAVEERAPGRTAALESLIELKSPLSPPSIAPVSRHSRQRPEGGSDLYQRCPELK
jgi:hypothetical protein